MSTVSSHIEITPGVAGGRPRVVGHRITVQDIVIWHERLGLSADAIAREYGPSLADVYAALAYYYDHREESTARSGRTHTASLGCARTPLKLKGGSAGEPITFHMDENVPRVVAEGLRRRGVLMY